MTKSDRKRRILSFLATHDLALPPKAIHLNMAYTSWTEDTTIRLLGELVDEGLVDRLDEPRGYYRISPAGRREIESSTDKTDS